MGQHQLTTIMEVGVQSLLIGLGLGLAAGVSPGPLLVLVITSTLRGGARQGIAVAATPLVTDVVVVAVALLTLGQIPAGWLAWLGVAGGVAVVLMGVQTVREGRTASLVLAGGGEQAPRIGAAFGRGGLVNLLSPHPWISWLTALGPLTVSTWRGSPPAAVLLVVGFYLTLVGAKVAVAVLVAGGRRRLTDAGYRRAVVVAGVALVALGIALFAEFGSRLGR